MTPVDTVCTEARAFAARHPALPQDAQACGMVAWGLLRAVAECPHCPGVFRVPQDRDWQVLVCPHCRGVWRYQPTAAAPSKGTHRKGTR